MPLACVGARIATTLRTATRRERARPISAHAHWPSRQDNAVCMHACFSLGLSVCVSVCLSVKSHLTYGASVRFENAVTYSAGKEGQKICGDLPETTALKSYDAKHERKSQYANYSDLPDVRFLRLT